MEGLLQLTVLVDYDEMINDDNLEAICGFTGAKNKDEAIGIHLSQLGDKLTGLVKDLPMVKFNLKGNLIPKEGEQEVMTQADHLEEDVTEEDSRELEPPTIVHDREELPKSPLDQLEEAIQDVSMDLGIPQSIKVNYSLMGEILKVDKGLGIVKSKGSINKFQGFDLTEDSMDELFIIKYKSYEDGSMGHHLGYQAKSI